MLLRATPDIPTTKLAKYLGEAQALSAAIEKNGGNHLRTVVTKVTVTTDGVSLHYDEGQTLKLLGLAEAVSSINEVGIKTQLKKRNSEDKLVIALPGTRKDLPLIKMLVQAHGWLKLLRRGQARTVADIAKLTGIQESYIYRHFKLALLAPYIQRALLNGTQPATLTLDTLEAGGYTQNSNAQRMKLMF